MVDIKQGDKTTGTQFPIIKSDGLHIRIKGGNVSRANVSIAVLKVDITLIASAVNYVFIDWVDNAIKANTTGFPQVCTELYEITTSTDKILSIVDRRSLLRMSAHSDFQTSDSWLVEVTFDTDKDWTDLDLSNLVSIPSGATGVWLEVHVKESGVIPSTTAVHLLLRRPGDTSQSQWKAILPQVSDRWFTRMVPVKLGDDGKTIQYKVNVETQIQIKLALNGWIFG